MIVSPFFFQPPRTLFLLFSRASQLPYSNMRMSSVSEKRTDLRNGIGEKEIDRVLIGIGDGSDCCEVLRAERNDVYDEADELGVEESDPEDDSEM